MQRAQAAIQRFLNEGSRYLWTDAYAVKSLLLLGDVKRAEAHVNVVHEELGRFREDDALGRGGTYLPPSSVERRVDLRGGLRINKPYPDADAPSDSDAFHEQIPDDFERDGQYLHYLVKWANALVEVAQASHNEMYLQQVFQLLDHRTGALSKFIRRSAFEGPRLCWKMNVALDRAMTMSSVQHDALQAVVCCLQAQHLAQKLGSKLDFTTTVDFLSAIVLSRQADDYCTADELGMGGLLSHTAQLYGMLTRPADNPSLHEMHNELSKYHTKAPLIATLTLEAAKSSATLVRAPSHYHTRASRRLCFREAGLCIGYYELKNVRCNFPLLVLLHQLEPAVTAATSFWERNYPAASQRHGSINQVMLAYLSLVKANTTASPTQAVRAEQCASASAVLTKED